MVAYQYKLVHSTLLSNLYFNIIINSKGFGVAYELKKQGFGVVCDICAL